MAVRVIDRWWYVDIRSGRKRYRKRSPENSRTGAKSYELLLRQRLARGEDIDKAADTDEPEPTFAEFAQAWFAEYVVPNLKPSQQRNVGYVLRGALIPYFGRMSLSEITVRTTEQYKARRRSEGRSNKTIKNHLSVLNRCLNTAHAWGVLKRSPPAINWPKCEPAEMDFLSFDECELLLSAADGMDYEMILLAVRTGMRQGELKGLQWSSINWENRSVTVRHSRDDNAKILVTPKSNRIRHIPLDTDAYEMLFGRRRSTGYVFTDPNKGPLTHKLITARLRRVCARAGFRKIGWHTLRHTFASHLSMRGVPITVVKELMGHADIKTTMRYSHLTVSVLRTAIDMLNPKTALDADFGQPVGSEWRRTQRLELVRKPPPPKV